MTSPQLVNGRTMTVVSGPVALSLTSHDSRDGLGVGEYPVLILLNFTGAAPSPSSSLSPSFCLSGVANPQLTVAPHLIASETGNTRLINVSVTLGLAAGLGFQALPGALQTLS